MKPKKIIKLCMYLILTGCLVSCYPNPSMKLDMNNPDDKLFNAIDGENLEMAKEAIAAGANINNFKGAHLRETLWHNESESNPLLIAMMRNSLPIAEYLLDCGTNVNYVNKYGRSVLSYCAEFKKNLISKVIEKGADINYVDKNGYTALDYALPGQLKFSIDSFKRILDYNPKILSTTIESVIGSTVKSPENTSNYRVLKMLFDADSTVDSSDDIKYAFLGQSDALVDMVKNKKNNPDYAGIVTSAAAAFGNKACLIYLLENTEVMQTISVDRLFRLAAMFGNVENMKYLLSIGANINSRDNSDYSAFELAAINNQIASLKLLLELGVDLTPSKKNSSEDAWCYAIKNHNMDMTKLLTPHRQYFNIFHALGTSIEEYNTEALAYLLDIGADPNYGYEVTNLLGKAAEIQLGCIEANA